MKSFETRRWHGRPGRAAQRPGPHDSPRDRHVRPAGGLLLRHRRLRRLLRRLREQVQAPADGLDTAERTAGPGGGQGRRQSVQPEQGQAEGVDDQRPRLGLARQGHAREGGLRAATGTVYIFFCVCVCVCFFLWVLGMR